MAIIDPTQKEIMNEQKAFLKGKSFKYKLDYFKQYYLVPTLLILGGILLVFFMIRSIVTAKDTAINVLYINGINLPEEEEFELYAGVDTKEYEVIYDNTIQLHAEAQDTTNYTSIQKWIAVISAKDGDVMIGDYVTMDAYATSSFYMDLRELFTEEEYAALEDRMIWVNIYDDDNNPTGETAPMFIDITDCKIMNEYYTYVGNQAVYSVAANTQRPEICKTYLKYLLEE